MTMKVAGPTLLTTVVNDVLTTPTSTVWDQIVHIHVANISNAQATFSAYLGASGGSTDANALFKGYPIDANSTYDYYTGWGTAMKNGTYLTALASVNSAMVMTIDYCQLVLP